MPKTKPDPEFDEDPDDTSREGPLLAGFGVGMPIVQPPNDRERWFESDDPVEQRELDDLQREIMAQNEADAQVWIEKFRTYLLTMKPERPAR